MSSERISPETRENFGKIQESIIRSKWVWAAWVGGLITTGASVMFFHNEYIQIFGGADLFITTAWQFYEGRVQEAKAGEINRREDRVYVENVGSFLEPWPRFDVKLHSGPKPKRKTRRDIIKNKVFRGK